MMNWIEKRSEHDDREAEAIVEHGKMVFPYTVVVLCVDGYVPSCQYRLPEDYRGAGSRAGKPVR